MSKAKLHNTFIIPCHVEMVVCCRCKAGFNHCQYIVVDEVVVVGVTVVVVVSSLAADLYDGHSCGCLVHLRTNQYNVTVFNTKDYHLPKVKQRYCFYGCIVNN